MKDHHKQIAKKLAAACQDLTARNLLGSITAGNISGLADDGSVVLTKTGVNLSGTLRVSDFVVIEEPSLKAYEECDEVTSEWRLHRALRLRPDPPAFVLHSHCPSAVAVSTLRHQAPLPFLHYYQVALGPNVRTIPWYLPGSEILAREVEKAAAADEQVILLSNHGCVIAAGGLNQLLVRAVVLDDVCKLYLEVAKLGPYCIPEKDRGEIEALLGISGNVYPG